MQHYRDVVLDRLGNVIVSALITVTDHLNNQTITVYSDAGGSIAQNPVITDTNGSFSFYIDPGRYDITVTKNNVILSVISDIYIAVTGINDGLPSPEANKLLSWNSSATELQNIDTTSLVTIVAFGTANANVFSGTGSQTVFTLTANPGALNNLDVSIAGVTQKPGIDYTWVSGTTLTFTSAPPSGTNNILVRYLQGLPQGYTDSAASSFIQSGTGAVSRFVQDKLREIKSVYDFIPLGVDPSVTDVTTYIQAALNLGVEISAPPGVYLVSGLVFKKGSKLRGSGNWSGTQQTDQLTGTTVFKYSGAGGTNSFVVRMSIAAVGVDPGSLAAGTATLMNAALTNVVIDGNQLAEFGLYCTRSWSNNEIDYITVTGTVKHGFYAAMCWNGTLRNWYAFKNIGAGITLGANLFTWASATVDQSTCIGFLAGYSGVNSSLVFQNQFNETINQDKEYGIGIFGSRALTMINAQAYQCGGAGIYTNTSLYPVLFVGGYNEGNGNSSGSTKNWDIWINGNVGSWNITFSHFHLGLTPAIRLTGTAPSRNEFGVSFERMASIGEIKADWNNFRVIDCNRSINYTGAVSVPASAELNPAGFKFDYTYATLNYYDEGTWTPSFVGTTTAGTYTYGAGTVGYFTRIGRQVFCHGRIVLTGITVAGTGSLAIAGLPFTSSAVISSASLTTSRAINLTTAVVSLTGSVSNNSTQALLYKRTAASASESNVVPADLSTTTDIAFAFSYFV